jgi:hypothetical protein
VVLTEVGGRGCGMGRRRDGWSSLSVWERESGRRRIACTRGTVRMVAVARFSRRAGAREASEGSGEINYFLPHIYASIDTII